MARPYSNDLRRRMVESVGSGVSRRRTAAIFQVSVSCVIKLMQRVDETGDVGPSRFGGFKTSPLTRHEHDIRAWIRETPEITIAEMHSRLAAGGTSSSPAAIARFLKRLGLTRKKRPPLPPSNRARTSPRPGKSGWHGRRA